MLLKLFCFLILILFQTNLYSKATNKKEFNQKYLSNYLSALLSFDNQKTKFNSKVEKLDIEEGDLFIFPAHLPHGVEENKSDDDRIVISFNIIINTFKN